jgi:hypothetical protein
MRLIVLSAFAGLAISGVVSATAQAERTEPCAKAEGIEIQLCIEGKEAGSPNTETIPFVSKKVPATVSKLEVAGGPTIECQKAENEGQFEVADSVAPSVSDLLITFSECAVVNNAETRADCEVGTIIVDGGNADGTGDRLDGTFPNPREITIAPSEGTTFTKITIKTVAGKPACTFATLATKVTGTQKCKLPNGETEAKVHELTCAKSESSLKYAALAATFELREEVELTTKEKFSVIETT